MKWWNHLIKDFSRLGHKNTLHASFYTFNFVLANLKAPKRVY